MFLEKKMNGRDSDIDDQNITLKYMQVPKESGLKYYLWHPCCKIE